MCQLMQWYAKSASGSPSVDSSQSSTARMRGSVGWKMALSRRKSPCTTVVAVSGGMFFGSQAIRLSIASIGSVSEAWYCLLQRATCRSM